MRVLDKDKENKGERIEGNKRFVSPSVALNSSGNLIANTVLSVLDGIHHYGSACGTVNTCLSFYSQDNCGQK